jgi:copper chaperone CopZ
METLHLNIEGMHCGGCTVGIQMTTEQLEGVSSAFLDLDGKMGVWEIDPARINADRIIQEITKLGYKATII